MVLPAGKCGILRSRLHLFIALPEPVRHYHDNSVMKTLIIRGIVIALLAMFSYFAWEEKHKPEQPPPTLPSLTADGPPAPEEAEPPGGYRNSMSLFIYILIICFTGGVMVLKWVIPALGDRVAESFYSAPEKSEQTATQKAMSLVAQGEYHKALAAFGRILEETPTDRFAVMESAKIYQDKLGDLDAAVEVLEKAVAGEWPADDRCFFLVKLADIHATQRCDFSRARELLEQLIRDFPESNHAANAHHKLREIEEQEFIARSQSA